MHAVYDLGVLIFSREAHPHARERKMKVKPDEQKKISTTTNRVRENTNNGIIPAIFGTGTLS